MLPHIKLSVDLIIFATFTFVTLVGLALGQDRLRHFALTVYVGLVLAYELGDIVAGFVNGHGQRFDHGTIRLILFIAPVLLMAFGKHAKSKGHRSSTIITLVIGIVFSALIVASGLQLMDPKTSVGYLGSSQIATTLFNLRLMWLAAVPITIVLGIIIKPKGGH